MVGEKTCNKCNKKFLGWDKEFHQKTGKWKLENHRRQDGKWCNKPPEKINLLTKHDIIICELCSTSKFGGIKRKEGLTEHNRIFHPNGEILTDLDYMIMGGMSRWKIKFWEHDDNYLKHLVNVK